MKSRMGKGAVPKNHPWRTLNLYKQKIYPKALWQEVKDERARFNTSDSLDNCGNPFGMGNVER